MSQKVSRKDLLKQDDAFVAVASQGAQWLQANQRVVFGAGALIFVAVAVGVGGREFVNRRDRDASGSLHQAEKILAAEVVTADANPAGEPPTFATEAERDKAARDAYVAASGKGGKVASLALFYAAQLSEKSGEDDVALEHLGKLLTGLSTEDSLYFLAVERAAYLREKKGDLEGAMQLWDRLVKPTPSFYGDRARFQGARLALGKGDATKAKNLLQTIEKDYPDSALKEQVRAQLATLGGNAGAPEASVNAPAAAPAPAAAGGSTP